MSEAEKCLLPRTESELNDQGRGGQGAWVRLLHALPYFHITLTSGFFDDLLPVRRLISGQCLGWVSGPGGLALTPHLYPNCEGSACWAGPQPGAGLAVSFGSGEPCSGALCLSVPLSGRLLCRPWTAEFVIPGFPSFLGQTEVVSAADHGVFLLNSGWDQNNWLSDASPRD